MANRRGRKILWKSSFPRRIRTERVAVIGPRVREELLFALPAGLLLPVLEGHFDGDLHRGGAVVRVKDAGKPRRGKGKSFSASSMAGMWVSPRKVEWATRPSWARDGFIDLRPVMAEEIHPEGRDAVEIAASLRVDEVVSFPPLDDQRHILLPIGHLGERMPDNGLVAIAQCFSAVQCPSP